MRLRRASITPLRAFAEGLAAVASGSSLQSAMVEAMRRLVPGVAGADPPPGRPQRGETAKQTLARRTRYLNRRALLPVAGALADGPR
jgi:hypothetical protein